MSESVAVIRDEVDNGVRADRVDGWDHHIHRGKTRVYLAGGGIVDLHIDPSEFVERLDRALTAMREDS